MAILPDLSYARTRSMYVPKNVDYIDKIGAGLEQNYNANKAKADLLLAQLNQLKVRDVNTPILEGIKQKAKAGIDAIAQRGDYENADLEVNQLANEVNNDPLLKGALQDYGTYEQYQKALGELKDTGQDRIAMATEYSNATNNRQVEYDPITGYKNIYKGYTPQKDVDMNKIVGTFADKIKASKEPIAIGKDEKGNPVYMGKANNGYYIVGQREGIDEGEALRIIGSHASSNPEIQGYVKENLMFDKFRKKFNPTTGQYDQFEASDFGDPADFYMKLQSEGYDPETFATANNLEKIYDSAFVERSIAEISAPYAAAVSFNNTTFDYKQDAEWLNKQKSQLALGNALAKMKAEEASQKRIIDYKYKKDEEKEKRATADMILANPVETEAVNLTVSEKNIEQIDSDLAILTAKKKAATSGGVDANGSPITFSKAEENKLLSLTSDKKLYESERMTYLGHSVENPEGQALIASNYNRYVKLSKNPENISLAEFSRRIKENDIKTPKQKAAAAGNRLENEVSDVNTWLISAKTMLAKSPEVQKAVNQAYSNEANGLFAFDDGSKSLKSSVLSKVKTTLTNNIIQQNGVGYDIIGSGQRLSDVLNASLIKTGEDIKWKKRLVDVQVIPLTDTQKGVGDQDIMYQMVIKDAKSQETIKSMRIRPQNQGSHADLMYTMNQELMGSFDQSTQIGNDAYKGVVNYELPQFKVGETKRLLDSQVNDNSPEGSLGVGNIVPVGNQNFVVVKTKTPVVDHFTEDDPNHPVTVLQEGYHIVQLRDNLPPDTQLTSDNVYFYAKFLDSGLFDSAVLNERNLGTDNLKKYGAKNKSFATHFASVQDALNVLHSNMKQK